MSPTTAGKQNPHFLFVAKVAVGVLVEYSLPVYPLNRKQHTMENLAKGSKPTCSTHDDDDLLGYLVMLKYPLQKREVSLSSNTSQLKHTHANALMVVQRTCNTYKLAVLQSNCLKISC